MKRGSLPAGKSIEMIGIIFICMVIFMIILYWITEGEHMQQTLEQGTLMYTVASSTNTLSSMEEGHLVTHLRGYFDVNVECDGVCTVTTTSYKDNGDRNKESEPIEIIGDIEPVKLKMVNMITLTKERGGKVILTGQRTEGGIYTELTPKEFSPLCIVQEEDDAQIRQIIKEVSARYATIDEELIAAIIKKESSWNPDAYRYEPVFQIKHVEEKPQWEIDDAWINPGEGQSIQEWFDSHPQRMSEISGLTPEQRSLTAQTRISASYGFMQVLYTTAYISCGYRGEPEGLYDPRTNIECGAKVLKEKIDMYGDISEALSAYNAGESIWRENADNKLYTEIALGYYNAYKVCAA